MKKIVKIVLYLAVAIFVVACGSETANTDSEKEIDAVVDGGIYKLRNKSTGRYLNMQLAGMVEQATLIQLGETNMLDELWRVKKDGNTWTLENLMTSRYISTRGEASEEGTIVEVKLNPETTGNWRLEEHDGAIRLIPDNSESESELSLGLMTDDISFLNRPTITVFEQPELSLWEFIEVELQEDLPRMLPVEGQIYHSSCPQIVKYGDTYYLYAMAPGISVKASEDLINWTEVGRVFPGGDPSWMTQEVPGYGIWAPGIFEIGGKYYAYYCISTLNGQNSAIGVAVNETLDHTAENYRWVDKGMVIRSRPGDPFNAIDPNISFDEDGNVWLTFGSYWNGIYQGKIDPDTGHFIDSDYSSFNHVARRPGSEAVEAPYIIKRDDYYYLFVAFGHIMELGYDNRVGRSKDINGPYIDREGVRMLEGGGSAVTKGLVELTRPGHASIFLDDDGTYYFVCEYFRDDPSTSASILSISTIVWDDEGWPITALTPNIAQRLPAKK